MKGNFFRESAAVQKTKSDLKTVEVSEPGWAKTSPTAGSNDCWGVIQVLVLPVQQNNQLLILDIFSVRFGDIRCGSKTDIFSHTMPYIPTTRTSFGLPMNTGLVLVDARPWLVQINHLGLVMSRSYEMHPLPLLGMLCLCVYKERKCMCIYIYID